MWKNNRGRVFKKQLNVLKCTFVAIDLSKIGYYTYSVNDDVLFS